MRAVSVLIKPASSACNMRCGYCFYRHIAGQRKEAFHGMMTLEVLEDLVRSAFECAEEYCGFAFQGGEPTLAGLPYFQEFLALQRKYNRRNIRVQNAVQTNGLLLDDAWAEFLVQNKFLTGVSLDGQAEIHNGQRPDAAGKGTYSRVMAAVRLLQRHQADFNILSVVTRAAAKHIAAAYRFYVKQNITHIQFIPVLDPLLTAAGETEWALSAEEYGTYLTRIFDVWFRDLQRGRYTSVRHIDNWLSILFGQQPEACSMTGRCSLQFVAEGDGGIYPCDFYVTDEWRMGRAGDSLTELAAGKTARAFLEPSFAVHEECRTCRWAPLCRSGCQREKVPDASGAPGLNRYCRSYRHFFENRFGELDAAKNILARRMAPSRRPV